MKQTSIHLINITRKCYTCKETKPVTQFKTKSQERSGYGYQCLDCSREQTRTYMREHADERNAKRREKYNSDPETRKRKSAYNAKRREKTKTHKKTYAERTYENRYKMVKNRCAQPSKANRGKPKEFDISLEHVLTIAEQQNHKCALTGTSFTFTKTGDKYHDAFIPSLDRIDSNIGYLSGNVQWTTVYANKSKMDYSDKFFKEMALHTVKNNDTLPDTIYYPIPPTHVNPFPFSLQPSTPSKRRKPQRFLIKYTPLRTCRKCGLEAHYKEDLDKFVKCDRLKHGRDMLCVKCKNKRTSELVKQRGMWIILFNWLHNPLRKCDTCNLEAWTTTELQQFAKNTSYDHDRMNRCTPCYNKRNRDKRRRDYPELYIEKPYLRKRTICGVEALTTQHLENFVKSHSSPHGRTNRCKPCSKTRYKQRDQPPLETQTLIQERANNQCELTGRGPCKGTLKIRHIDKNPTNHTPTNLVLLCQRHTRKQHMLTNHPNPTFTLNTQLTP